MSILLFFSITILPSCSLKQDPKLYEVEIEDDFKFQMAQAMAYTAAAFMELDKGDVDKTVNFLIKVGEAVAEVQYSEGKSSIARYDLALKEYSQADATFYYLWEQYHSFDGKVHFGEFIKQPKDGDFSVWTTTEKNSDIRVTFKINKKPEFQVVLDEKDLQVYLTNLTSAHYEDHLNSAIESAIDEAIDEAVDEALLDLDTYDEW